MRVDSVDHDRALCKEGSGLAGSASLAGVKGGPDVSAAVVAHLLQRFVRETGAGARSLDTEVGETGQLDVSQLRETRSELLRGHNFFRLVHFKYSY